MSHYQRELPRDLFNESKLLKCLGRMTLLIHDGHLDLTFLHKPYENLGIAFLIEQDESDGGIYCSNLVFRTPKGKKLYFKTSLNCKSPYPLELEDDVAGIMAVLDDVGDITEEFKEFLIRADST